MSKYSKKQEEKREIFIGIDVHLKTWDITICNKEGVLKSMNMLSNYLSLRRHLEKYEGHKMTAVYEAGYFGFGLHDYLRKLGVNCIVVPPTRIPTESGNRVKTDRKDSRKLAYLLSKGLLKGVYVPSEEERCVREVIRTYHQIVENRVRVQNQIKAKLIFHGIDVDGMSRSSARIVSAEAGAKNTPGI